MVIEQESLRSCSVMLILDAADEIHHVDEVIQMENPVTERTVLIDEQYTVLLEHILLEK